MGFVNASRPWRRISIAAIGTVVSGWLCILGVGSVDPARLTNTSQSSAALLQQNQSAFEALQSDEDSIDFQPFQRRNRSILQRAPLNDQALAYAALGHHLNVTTQQNTPTASLDSQAILLLQKAQARNPRNRISAQLLLIDATNQGRFEEAVSQLGLLYRLAHNQRGNRRDLIKQFAGLQLLRHSRESVEQALETDPLWAEPLMRHLIITRRGANLIDLDRILARYAVGAPPEKTQSLARNLITALADTGHYRLADTIRQTYIPPRTAGAVNTLNDDPDLVQSAPAPFGWSVNAGRFGSAEFETGGGLYTVLNGGEDTVLAEQVFIWPDQGLTEIGLKVEGQASPRPKTSQFIIRLTCITSHEGRENNQRSDIDIGEIVIDREFANRGVAEARFPLPAQACGVGRVRLLGVSGVLTRTVTAAFNRISVTAVRTGEEAGESTGGRDE